MTLRERVQAMAEEYQRDPRWLRSQDVGKMMDSWLSEPDIQPGPCMEQAPTLTTGVRSVSCTLLAGHAGGHTNGVTSWRVAPSPDADVERADFRPGLRGKAMNAAWQDEQQQWADAAAAERDEIEK